MLEWTHIKDSKTWSECWTLDGHSDIAIYKNLKGKVEIDINYEGLTISDLEEIIAKMREVQSNA